MENITDEARLRERYAAPADLVRRKVLPRLDAHCRNFIALSPFLCLGTSTAAGGDVTPRGDAPGFVHVLDDATLALPDWPGNNRLDALTNILANPKVGLLFLIPGVDEMLRVNGSASISASAALLARWNVDGRHRQPKSVVLIAVEEAYLHCGKALMRSRLWHDDYKVDRAAALPSLGRMLKDQIPTAPHTVEELEAAVNEGYTKRLY